MIALSIGDCCPSPENSSASFGSGALREVEKLYFLHEQGS